MQFSKPYTWFCESVNFGQLVEASRAQLGHLVSPNADVGSAVFL